MRGILWKWLFTLGMLLWGALCGVEYYRKHIMKQPEFLEVEIKTEEIICPIQKKLPPALTFWKTLTMVLSISALIYIKRSSFKKCSKTNMLLSYAPYKELEKTTLFPATVNYYKDVKNNEILPDLYSNEPRPKLSPIKKIPYSSSIIGVQLVQKKLENLEKNLASLKQRHQESSSTINTSSLNSSSIVSSSPEFIASSGIVSGSPEFRRFLNSCTKIKNSSESLEDISINSSQLSESSKVPGSDLISTTSSSDPFPKLIVPQVLQTSSSDTDCVPEVKTEPSTILEPQNIPIPIVETRDNVSNSFITKQEDSWSTISDNDSTLSAKTDRQVLSTVSGQITEILKVKNSFSKSSKVSEEIKTKSEESNISFESNLTDASLLVEYDDDDDDDLEVPGSNLVSTSGNTSICTSTTLMSCSESNLPMCMGDNADIIDDEDVLNTLD